MDRQQSKFKVGDKVIILMYNREEFRHGEVVALMPPQNRPGGAPWYKVRRRDGRVVELDGSEIEPEKVGYSDRLEVCRRTVIEERIADLLFTESDLDETASARLGRDILYDVLREFRPDLFEDAPAVGKYGTPEGLADKLYPGEPFFAVLGRDQECKHVIADYSVHVRRDYGEKPLPEGFLESLQGLYKAVEEWQKANPEKVKLAD